MAEDVSVRRLPIKIVIPHDHDFSPKPRGGDKRKVFGDVNRSVQDALISQTQLVRRHFEEAFKTQNLPAVAKVLLKDDSLAKSHRPKHLFSRNTCPIFGGEAFGTLLVRVSNRGLDHLEQAIDQLASENVKADVSTIERIEPYTAADVLGEWGEDRLSQYLREKTPEKVKARIFQHNDTRANQSVLDAFNELVRKLGIEKPEPLRYSDGVRVFRLRGLGQTHIQRLAGFVGTQSLSPFPQFELLAQYISHGAATSERFPDPDAKMDYPLVGLIDSGTDPKNPHLARWVVSRDEVDVPPADQDNNHGSFVAGLIANGRVLNHGDSRFPSVQAKIVDVVAMPRAGTPVYEDDLLATIRRAIKDHPDVKVWNLSISKVSDVCRDDRFSDFAMALDEIQEQHDITFVVCAGNFTQVPFRGWPAQDLGESDRVHPPADSAYALTVGAVAHSEHASTCVKKAEPSPFSRRGPGAACLPKPEVCHIGGNCDKSGDCRQVGVLSLDGLGNVAEAVGTSFSTPLVAAILANVRAGVAEPISRNLAKALLIQSAALNSGQASGDSLRYYGFGVPGEVSDILTCAPWQATLIFEPEIPPNRKVFAKLDFPIPKCFRRPDNKVEGEILMTLAYSPPRDPNAGAEYCQVNIDASLGTYDPDSSGKRKHSKMIPMEPKDYSKLAEKNLVHNGFKWSPVKVFRRKLTRQEGTRWRLMMELLLRAGVDIVEPQTAALVVTLFDPEFKKPVYNDVVQAMRTAGWVTEDLQVDERIQLRRGI